MRRPIPFVKADNSDRWCTVGFHVINQQDRIAQRTCTKRDHDPVVVGCACGGKLLCELTGIRDITEQCPDGVLYRLTGQINADTVDAADSQIDAAKEGQVRQEAVKTLAGVVPTVDGGDGGYLFYLRIADTGQVKQRPCIFWQAASQANRSRTHTTCRGSCRPAALKCVVLTQYLLYFHDS